MIVELNLDCKPPTTLEYCGFRKLQRDSDVRLFLNGELIWNATVMKLAENTWVLF